MYHGVPVNSETIAVAFGILVWIIRSIARGLKQISRPALPPVQSQAPGPPQNMTQFSDPAPPQALPATQPRPAQFPPVQPLPQAARPPQAFAPPRQPPAGGPAVPAETNRQDFVRQEQELFASEPAGLSVSLTSPAPPTAVPNALFGGTDDLVRAIILQEVLGPPHSRCKPSP